MKRPSRPSSSAAQRGMVSLTVAMIFLFGMTLVLFFASRGLIFEQRTSVNLLRATKANEVAEAGIDWALANLNHQQKIAVANCLVPSPASGGVNTFRDHVAATSSSLVMTPTGNQAACVRTSAGLSCHCPSGAAAPAPGGTGPAFLLSFNAAPNSAAGTPQPRLLEVVATGCATAGSECVSGASSASDGVATVRVLAGIVPMMLNPPASPLTACATIDIGGATGMKVTNDDASTGGVTINAGGDYITNPSTNVALTSVPGSPGVASVYKSDTSLSNNCPTVADPSKLFRTFFGMSKDEYKAMAQEITCSGASDCETKLTAAINGGAQYFWFNSDLALGGSSTFGSLSKPIAIVVGGTTGSNGTVDLSGSVKINGLVYSTTTNWNDAFGNSYVRGAMLSEGSFTATGSMTVDYDKDLLDKLANGTGPMARVPGSWRDSAGNL